MLTFLDRDRLPAGQPWQPALKQAIDRCGAVAVLIGPSGMGNWQYREVLLARDRQAEEKQAGRSFPVIPVLLPRADDPPGDFLRLQTWVDLRGGLDNARHLHRLFSAIRGQAPADDDAVRQSFCPYRGLLPFREEDASLFHGREDAVKTLLDKLREHDLLTVVGRSGSGKSSVVRAGLVPALRRDDNKTWSVVSLRPGPQPLHLLVHLFSPPLPGQTEFQIDRSIAEGVEHLRNDKDAIGQRIRNLLAGEDERGTDRLLLFVDQWEELYTQALTSPAVKPEQAAADVARFIDLLLNASRTSPCTVVLTVRADFYGEFLHHADFAKAVTPAQVNLPPIGGAGLRLAIREPAEAVGLSVDPPLVNELLDEVAADPGKLPLLEYALKETWQEALRKPEGRRLTLTDYGAVGGIDGAMAQRADRVYDSLTEAEKTAARSLFVSLVAPGDDKEDTRTRMEYPPDGITVAVIQKFAGQEVRLLVAGAGRPARRPPRLRRRPDDHRQAGRLRPRQCPVAARPVEQLDKAWSDSRSTRRSASSTSGLARGARRQ